MSVQQFGRFIRVVVGTGPATAIDVSELDVSFKITRKLSARAGTCDLEIFNLTPEHFGAVIDAPRRTTYVAVDAGYRNSTGSNVSRLFTGDKRTAIPSRDGASWKLELSAGDGAHALRDARVNRSFAAGVPVTSVVQHIAESMGVGIGNAVEALRGASFRGGVSVFEDGTVLRGRAADELGRLCDATGMEFSVQDGNLLLLPMGQGSERTAIRISADSGMIESPVIVDRRTVKAKCLIQPGLIPGQRVVIDSRLVQGVYRIHEVTYSGGRHESDFTAEMTCQIPRGPLLDRSAPGATALPE